MLVTENHTDELRHQGYTIIENVVTEAQCDIWVGQYKEWLAQFEGNEWPFPRNFPTHRYNIANFETTWQARLATKDVFSELWNTEKLLSTVDIITIGRPPENSEEDFAQPGQHSFCSIQDVLRKGLHVYHGYLYLERADEDDWTLHILEGSHLYLDEFHENHEESSSRRNWNRRNYYSDKHIEWFESKGCNRHRISVPKGGMVLCDSRLVYESVRPQKDRKNAGRWYFALSSCMAPAIWASAKDLEMKQKAYKIVATMCRWPCQGLTLRKSKRPPFYRSNVSMPTEHCETSKSKTAKELCGMIPYDFKDGKCNGPDWTPEWRKSFFAQNDERKQKLSKIAYLVIIGICVGVIIGAFKVVF